MSESIPNYAPSHRLNSSASPQCLPYHAPGFRPPTTDEIRDALKVAGLSGTKAGLLLGVNGRTIRKWTGGQSDMPYAAWRLLLLSTGIIDADTQRDVPHQLLDESA